MLSFKTLLTGILVMVLSVTVAAATVDLAGVKVADSATVAGTKLQLNGAGIRYKFVKLYVGSLYTNKKVHTLEELLDAPGPKRMQLTFVREMSSAPFGKLFTRGIEDNVPKANFSKLVPSIIRMGDIFNATKSFSPGEGLVLDWVPGTGLIISVKGQPWGEPFVEPEFFAALMAIWFGPNPGDWKLKDALLDVAK